MSEWRQRGFVQDSDEEEGESQIESQHSEHRARPYGRVERVLEEDGGQDQVQDAVTERHENFESLSGSLGAKQKAAESATGRPTPTRTPTRRQSPARPIPSPFTPLAQLGFWAERSESPDPLQSLPRSKLQSHEPALSSPRNHSSVHKRSSPEQIELRAFALPSQILGETTEAVRAERRNGNVEQSGASDMLGQYGSAPDEFNPADDSDNESKLSDYPSDLSETEAQPAVGFAVPHRRTAVQVLIPSSTALQLQLAQEEARRRHFRQRKPIQLHPYALEGERYRREVQSRGLKPVPRERSPQPRQRQTNQETQEEDFNPLRDYSSSPPDPEIFVSTPVAPGSSKYGQQSSTKRPRPAAARRRSPSLQLRVPKPAKKRRLSGSLTAALVTPGRTSESTPVPLNIWSVPPNSPPYSSSPPLNAQVDKLLSRRNTDSLPTPSNSSTFHEETPHPVESDSDHVIRCAPRSGSGLRRPTRIILSDGLSSDSDEASGESEQEEGELQQVSKRIRGVLPASWLRMDQQAQERRQALARQRARLNVTLSPEPAGPQRGVAQRIIRPPGRAADVSRSAMDLTNVMVISDDSDPEQPEASTYQQPRNVQDSVEDASALAAMFDDRYADSGDDLASMEHDRLPLPSLGGPSAKRKRQPKITDAFGNVKRPKTLASMLINSRPSKPASSSTSHRNGTGRRQARRTPPPALSILDAELPVQMPQFLRLAMRAARRDINQARQSPRRKQIRLHTAQDTEDANVVLKQWRQGVLRPKIKTKSGQRERQRQPLVDTADNQQQVPQANNIDEDAIIGVDADSMPKMSHQKPLGRRTVAPKLLILQRSSTPSNKSNRMRHTGKAAKPPEKMRQHGPLPLRAAQLEGEEKSFASSHRKIAFQKGLQRVEQQAARPTNRQKSLINPQLARFLADDDAILPPLPTAKDVGEAQVEHVSGTGTVVAPPAPSRRLVRKPQAQRVDVDAREYRQPSEPTFAPVAASQLLITDGGAATKQQADLLRGLGPYGTRYPKTFDITSLKGDTYFHADTFVGSEDLRRALLIGRHDARDLDEPAGHCIVFNGTTTIRCGPWNDETHSHIFELITTILLPLDMSDDHQVNREINIEPSKSLSTVLRALTSYFANHLSFVDPIDRVDFTRKMISLIQTLFARVSTSYDIGSEALSATEQTRASVRVLNYLLVISVQVQLVAEHLTDDNLDKTRLLSMIKSIARLIIKSIAKSTQQLYEFHEKNRLYRERENGIQENDVLTESIVVSMHALDVLKAPSLSFWDLISQELSAHLTTADQVQTFENVWATIFALLPFEDFDMSGIPDRSRARSFDRDNWGCLCQVLRRIVGSYLGTSLQQGSSINEYIRTNLTRCYILINEWQWIRPDQILNVIFDFYGKHGLKPLRRETVTGSALFLRDLALGGSLAPAPNDSSFHIALKCLATGLQGMAKAYPEKKIRSFVFRRIPNHGRMYPKDQPLEEASLAALRNHHDLLSTLYCAAPPSCRPKLEHIRDLVSHETSHREACRVSVLAWANLSTFQLSTNESYDSARPLAHWHKNILHQTLKQYRLAKIEAEDYLTSGVLDGTSEVAKAMVHRAMAKNQEQAIATLRDSIAGMKRAVECAKDQVSLAAFLIDSDFIQLLELPHLDDHRLVTLVRDTLAVLRRYAAAQMARQQQQQQQQQHESQPISEESQDYGDFPDLDELAEPEALQPLRPTITAQSSRLDFIQGPLWHLMSNAFGGETSRDDNLLMDCIDTWVAVASDQVTTGHRHWSDYMGSFGQFSWKQLRRTEHTNKFGPYFMAALITCSPSAYDEHRHDFLTALLLCLADRESMLRFQHRLLNAILLSDSGHPFLRNLPFFRAEGSAGMDVTSETLRSRRLALISSLLSNMREDVYVTAVQEPSRVAEVKRSYAAMLKDFMSRLKDNYLQLQQGEAVTGSYVEFVQRIVQFLKQYTGDICPVLPFFTDSVAFPLPSTDPTYVVGRLCGYAPRARETGTAKQLSVFIQTVAQQAAADNQQVYLVDQLTKALCTDEAPVADRTVLRTVLLQDVFPAYIESVFSSRPGHLVARPILQCLPAVLGEIIYDLRVSQPVSLSTAIQSIVSIAHAFVRATEILKGDLPLFQQLNVLDGLAHMFDVAMTIVRLLDYTISRTSRGGAPPLVTYLEQFAMYAKHMINGKAPDDVPSYRGDASKVSSNAQHAEILAFCQRGLQSSLETNWSVEQNAIMFGQGRTRKQVAHEMESSEREKTRTLVTLQAFQDTLQELAGAAQYHQVPTFAYNFNV